MNSKELIKILNQKKLIKKIVLANDFDISSIEIDSRKIVENSIYIAIKGYSTDGHNFIESAIKKGAKLIVCENLEDTLVDGVNYIQVENSRKVEAIIANIFYENPTQNMDVIAITGTNGKTSTTYILESILQEMGIKTGVIGTIGYKIGDKLMNLNNTTPDSLELMQILNTMNQENVKVVIMEVSSHALSLYRVYGLNFNIVAFTNLTQDHLDFHKDMNDYYYAKKLLFTEYLDSSNKKNKKALINIDDKYGETLFNELNCEKYSMSVNSKNADFFLNNYNLQIDKTELEVNDKDKLNMKTSLIGEYNLYNILMAISIAKLYKVDNKNIQNALLTIKQVPGRLEQVANKAIFIDYAHTPDAVEKVTKTLKSLTKGKLITVLGAGGDRDKTKRPLMALAGIKNSDFVILTSDNPRTEDPEMILDDLELPLKKENKGRYYARIVNRANAIKRAVEMLEVDDVLVICGKGHENYQIIGKEKAHFSDYEEVLNTLQLIY